MIDFDTMYYICGVSSCKKHVFCSQNCWRAHVPLMRHKDAWAEEERSPKQEDTLNVGASREKKRSKVMAENSSVASGKAKQEPKDILIVASKLKNYIKVTSDLSTSAQVMERLSNIVRKHCDEAIAEAKKANRKTVLDRDFL